MQYSNYDMKNNVHATLSTAISSVATTIQLTAWQGARFWNTFPQIATLESFDENWKVIKREIVQITWRSGDNLTVVRAFAPCPENDDANSQSQNAISFNADDTISLYIPKEIFDIIKKSLNDIYDNGANNMRTEVVSWLQVEVNPWQVLVWSAYYDFAGWTITLTDNATNYLEIDEDGNLANNTTGRNDENTKLAIITTSGGSVTNIKDRRLWTVWWKIGGVNIHDLTEKISLSPDDEFILADSEAIFQNKKIKAWNIIWIWEWIAIEDIDRWDMITQEAMTNDSETKIAVWFTNRQKIAVKRIWNWISFNTIVAYASKYWTPNTLNVRIETDNNWNPSWTLIDANAYWIISWNNLTTNKSTVSVSLAWSITIPDWTICHVVFSIDTVSDWNFFYIYWFWTTPNLFKIEEFDWSNWGVYTEYRASFSLSRATYITQKTWIEYWWSWNWYFISCSEDWQYVIYCWIWSWSHCYLRTLKLSTPNDISTATVYKSLDMGSWYCYWWWVSSDWTKIMLWYAGALFLYTMSTAWDVSTATQTSMRNPYDIWFTNLTSSTVFCIAPDWQHIYFKNWWATYWGILTNAWDGSAWTYKWYENRLTAYCYWMLMAEWWKDFYIAHWSNKQVSQYVLSTPYDPTTATLVVTATPWLTWDTIWHWMWFLPNWDLLILDYVSSYTTIKQFADSLSYWKNILANITGNWLYNNETWKADNTMILWNYIPMSAVWDYNAWQKVKYNISYNNNKTWLVPWTKYYLWSNWWTTDVSNDYEVWIAIEPTILKLKQTY